MKSRNAAWLKNFRGKKGRRRVNPLKRKIMYNYSSRLQSLGPGMTVVNLTTEINEAEMSGLSYIEIDQLIRGNGEYQRLYQRYCLSKIEEIAVTIYPNDNLNNIPTFVNLDWFECLDTMQAIQTVDRTKIVYNDLKKPKTFFFKPPNMIINGVNYRQYINNLTNPVYQGNLNFVQASGTLRGRVDVRVTFRVPTEFLTKEQLKLKKVNKILKINNNENKFLGLSSNHEDSFTIGLGEEEPEEEKLEGDSDEEEKEKPLELFDWNFKEKKEKIDKLRLKNKEKRKKKKEKKKKEKIKKQKLNDKLNYLKEKQKKIDEKYENKKRLESSIQTSLALIQEKIEDKKRLNQQLQDKSKKLQACVNKNKKIKEDIKNENKKTKEYINELKGMSKKNRYRSAYRRHINRWNQETGFDENYGYKQPIELGWNPYMEKEEHKQASLFSNDP